MDLNRMYRIAQTGQINESTPVENIMAQYKPQEQGGFWGGVKNFAGSNGGRMLLGGLAGGALGALSGRNLNEALTGGIMGATGAAKGITMRSQYNDNIARQQQDRADRISEAENQRQFQMNLAKQQIEANKAAADLAFERKLRELQTIHNLDNQWQDAKLKRQDDYVDGLNLAPEEATRLKAGFRGINISEQPNGIQILTDEYLSPNTSDERRAEIFPQLQGYYGRQNEINSLIPQEKKYESGDLGIIQFFTDHGYSVKDAAAMAGKMSPTEKLEFEAAQTEAKEGIKNKYATVLEGTKQQGRVDLANLTSQNQLNNQQTMAGVNFGYNQRAADAQNQRDLAKIQYKDQIARDFEQFKTTLPPASVIEANAVADKLQEQGLNVTAADILYEDFSSKWLDNNDKRIRNQFLPTQLQQGIDKNNSEIAKNNATIRKINEELGNPALDPLKKEQLKTYAQDLNEYNNAVSKLPELKATVEKLGELADDATFTYAGRGIDFLARQLGKTTKGDLARSEYESIINNQILPLLRDTFGAQFTEREGEKLQKTLGDPNGTPEQKKALLNAFIRQKTNDVIAKKRKIDSYNFGNYGNVVSYGLNKINEQPNNTGVFTIERDE